MQSIILANINAPNDINASISKQTDSTIREKFDKNFLYNPFTRGIKEFLVKDEPKEFYFTEKDAILFRAIWKIGDKSFMIPLKHGIDGFASIEILIQSHPDGIDNIQQHFWVNGNICNAFEQRELNDSMVTGIKIIYMENSILQLGTIMTKLGVVVHTDKGDFIYAAYNFHNGTNTRLYNVNVNIPLKHLKIFEGKL